MHPSSFTQCPRMASWLRLPTYMTEVTKSERLCVAVESRRPKGKQSKVEPLPECSWELGSALSIGPSLPVGLPHPHCFFWLHFLLDKLLSPRSFPWGLFRGAQPRSQVAPCRTLTWHLVHPSSSHFHGTLLKACLPCFYASISAGDFSHGHH